MRQGQGLRPRTPTGAAGSRGRAPGLALSLLLSLPTYAQAQTGPALFAAQCALCHQADGGGAPGQYPPLRNRINQIATTPAGRHYLTDVLASGMAGQITAAGQTYIGYMPSFRQLQAADAAAILNHVISLGTAPPTHITEADITAARARNLTPTAVHEERKALASAQPLP